MAYRGCYVARPEYPPSEDPPREDDVYIANADDPETVTLDRFHKEVAKNMRLETTATFLRKAYAEKVREREDLAKTVVHFENDQDARIEHTAKLMQELTDTKKELVGTKRTRDDLIMTVRHLRRRLEDETRGGTRGRSNHVEKGR